MSYYVGHNKIIKSNKNSRSYLRSNEILLNNVLDKDFQKLLLPFNIMHSIIFLKKYNIRDNFITPNSFKSKVLSFCCLLFMVLFFVYLTAINDYDDYLDESVKTQLVIIITNGIDIVFYPIAILYLFIHKVCCSNDNVKLILKLQEIEKITKFSKTNKMFIYGYWSLGLGVFLYIFVIIVKGVYDNNFSVYAYVCIYCINMNSLYSACFMNLFNNNMKICTCLLKEKFESSYQFDVQFEELHICYMNILDALRMFKKTLRAAVRFL